MRVCLVGRDMAPSEAFEMLAAGLSKAGHSGLTLMVGKGKPLAWTLEDIEVAVSNSDVIIVGMSSKRELAEPEIGACAAAVAAGKPFGFYGDTYHCHERAGEGSWFGPFRNEARFFFAVNGEEAEAAKLVFPNATCVATGNPKWENYAFPRKTREEVRRELGVTDDEIFVLAPGGKSPDVNLPQWEALLEAFASLMTEDLKFRVVFSTHPGDRTPEAVDPIVIRKGVERAVQCLKAMLDDKQLTSALIDAAEQGLDKDIAAAFADPNANLGIYGDLLKFSAVPVMMADRNVKTSDLVPGADLIVEWGSSIGIEAAHQRLPIVSLATMVGRRRMASTSKTVKWELCELGVSVEVDSADGAHSLAEAIGDLLEDSSAQKERQAQVYPVPAERGTSIRKMVEALEALVPVNPAPADRGAGVNS